jgi:hypothetical protein
MSETTRFPTDFKPVRPEAPDMPQGYTHLRNGVFEHTAQAKMSPTDFCVYTTLLRFADFSTGICISNAESIAAHWGGAIPSNTARKCLIRLREEGYIMFAPRRGERGSYPILIDKYEPGGNLLGWRLNAQLTYDVNDPCYEWVSPTPITLVYSPEELAGMNDLMKSYIEWAEGIAAKDTGIEWVTLEPRLVRYQVRGKLVSGRSQVVLNLVATRSQVGRRLVTLYTATLLHGITDSRNNSSTSSGVCGEETQFSLDGEDDDLC